MPTGIYNHKPHSEETKKKISINRKGKWIGHNLCIYCHNITKTKLFRQSLS